MAVPNAVPPSLFLFAVIQGSALLAEICIPSTEQLLCLLNWLTVYIGTASLLSAKANTSAVLCTSLSTASLHVDSLCASTVIVMVASFLYWSIKP